MNSGLWDRLRDPSEFATAVPIPMPGILRVINIVKVEKSGTDATDIVVWPDDENI